MAGAVYSFEEHMIKKQARAEEAMLKELRSGAYTIDNPLVSYNLYLINPLSAVISFYTEEETAVTVTVLGKAKEGNITHTFPRAKEHVLPVVGLLGAEAVFHMEGRLPQRPLHPLDEVLTAHGMTVRQEGSLLFCGGKLRPGAFSLPGDVSSQYISGLLMALPLLDEASSLTVTGQMESAAYIAMTESVLNRGGIALRRSGSVWHIPGGQRCRFPADIRAEGDWSNAAFFLCMGALSPAGISVRGLDLASPQGDRAVLDILTAMGAEVSVSEEAVTVRRGALRGVAIDAGPIPDLIPVLCVTAAGAAGDTQIFNAGRLRLKESDRLRTTAVLLTALGGHVEEQPSGLLVHGTGHLTGGTADACGDHRIAMSAATAACLCTEPVTVSGSECVAKSYPDFWNDFSALKGGAL